MKLNLGSAIITTQHPTSSYGIPVLVLLGGNARGSAETADLILLSATAEELAALSKGGYSLQVSQEPTP